MPSHRQKDLLFVSIDTSICTEIENRKKTILHKKINFYAFYCLVSTQIFRSFSLCTVMLLPRQTKCSLSMRQKNQACQYFFLSSPQVPPLWEITCSFLANKAIPCLLQRNGLGPQLHLGLIQYRTLFVRNDQPLQQPLYLIEDTKPLFAMKKKSQINVNQTMS